MNLPTFDTNLTTTTTTTTDDWNADMAKNTNNKKRMIMNAYGLAGAASVSFGQWRDPQDRTSRGYTDLDHWVGLAQLCERGFFDAVFFADGHGIYDVYQQSAVPAVKYGVQIPSADPTALLSLLAHQTNHIGLICTVSTGYYPPFHTARLFSSLDHYTRGRIGWNIVTSFLESAYRNGMGERMEHDERYDRADEYMDVVYQLWEQSWDNDAVVLDSATAMHTDPSKVYRINHSGKYFQVEGPHQCEPSAQRTPFLVQAGGSPRGVDFCGKHAELTFAVHTSIATAAAASEKIREAAAREGRDPSTIKILPAASVVVAATDEEAQEKYKNFEENGIVDGALALFGGWTGVDLTGFEPGDKMTAFESQGMQHIAGIFGTIDSERDWTFAEMCEYMKVSSITPVFVGSPTTVADEMERWMDEADLDGFNLIPITNPGDFEDFVEMMVPELQRRGRMRTSYDGDTLRENVYGSGHSQLLEDHPARRILKTYAREPLES